MSAPNPPSTEHKIQRAVNTNDDEIQTVTSQPLAPVSALPTISRLSYSVGDHSLSIRSVSPSSLELLPYCRQDNAHRQRESPHGEHQAVWNKCRGKDGSGETESYSEIRRQSPGSPIVIRQDPPTHGLDLEEVAGHVLAQNMHRNSPVMFSGIMRYFEEQRIFECPPARFSSGNSTPAKARKGRSQSEPLCEPLGFMWNPPPRRYRYRI
jgi:hypothetical protein